MKTKILLAFTICFLTLNGFAQTNLNTYKYVIVPNKFDFLKENDQYQLNSLAKFLFEKYGFEAIMEGGKYPDDLLKNRCLALKSNLLKDSGMFKTKLAIELKNCNDAVVFTSEMGESREKEYKKAFTEALRNAFNSIEALGYSYQPSAEIANVIPQETQANNAAAQEIERLKQEIASIKIAKDAVVEVAKPEVVVVATPNLTVNNDAKTVAQPTRQVATGVLYAQAIENGFQLVDSSPKVVYKIKKTGIADVFMVENKNATLYKKGENWIMEYYENNELKQEVLTIKF